MDSVRRLTEYSPGGGCACKLPQQMLDEVVEQVGRVSFASHGSILVGLDPADDAAVYAIDDDRAWVVTCDFITPVVDDPYDWGRIAAANALSDVYAMGGRPVLTLNLLAWPLDLPDYLPAVLSGGADVAASAGAWVVGGHSVVDTVPKYGMVALGEADPRRLLIKGGGEVGDVLVLTKPLGVGIIVSAVKRGNASDDAIRAATESMTTLNARAAQVACDANLRGATDVSGYGLAGHLHEICRTSGVAARLYADLVPVLDGAGALLGDGYSTDGGQRTLQGGLAGGWLDVGASSDADQTLVCDPQTSGGLLIAVPERQCEQVIAELDGSGTVVGELVAGPVGRVELRRSE